MDENQKLDDTILLELTSDVVAAYVGNNPISSSDLPGLIKDIHAALAGIAGAPHEAEKEKPKPAVSIKKSLGHEYLICLEDGKPFKSLKRHLKTHYDLSPDQYREKWGLPADYPMVAPAYAERRSQLAKQMKLGQKRS
ncbi:MucR family transcriptional regulator [Pseudahrensia aquimaris]|uniref:MucR family transcriptional regulator n=1 Tax=Pseudahrensia aquimaris TaxID=744461 RepID=A0ABW3FBP7_9HYPH